ncbi:MAG: HAD family hydrolase [Ruminococcaceae bacterium]|nr:HAD family hydrolase [Oscillospiraceae bacterium]
MDYTYCIWDFNGTIFDDVDAGIESVNALLFERRLPIIESKEAYREVFDFPIIEYYRKIGFDFEKEPYEVIAPLWVELYMENSKRSKLFDDVISAIDFFDERGIKQSVLSATEKNMLDGQLCELGIFDRFEEIMGRDNIYAESKLELAQSWKEKHRDEKVLFIGDTTHDYETARILGADCYLISAGHHPEHKLRAVSDEVKVFGTLRELIEYLK